MGEGSVTAVIGGRPRPPDRPPVCAACRQPIGADWQVTDGKVFALCCAEDCTRWARIRGLKIVRSSGEARRALPVDEESGPPALFACGRTSSKRKRR